MGTFIVLAIVVIVTGLAVRSLINEKKKGISFQCGGNCKSCAGHCSAPASDIKDKKKH